MKTSKPFKKTYGKISDSLHWSKYDIPWNEIVRTKKFKSHPHSSIFQFGKSSHIYEKRYSIKNYFQQPVELRKNAQLLNEYIICLLCRKPGHLAHECIDYEPKAYHSKIQDSSSMSLSPKLNYMSNIQRDKTSQDNLHTTHINGNDSLPIVLVKSPINTTSSRTKNENQAINNDISSLNSMIDFVNIYHPKILYCFVKIQYLLTNLVVKIIQMK